MQNVQNNSVIQKHHTSKRNFSATSEDLLFTEYRKTKTNLIIHKPNIFKRIRDLDNIDTEMLIRSLDPDNNML